VTDEPTTIARLRAAYESGSLAPADVVAGAYERALAAGPPDWIALVPWREVRGRIERLRTERRPGSLAGIPFAVKDNIDVAGVPTTAGCPAFAYTPTGSAFVVDLLIGAGAVPIGKTNMDQFATGLAGTRSPYGACASVVDARYVAGGSSSGSAVVVADGTVPFALGTDTAGSGRVPAAFNGIVGVKPSRGLVSTRGVLPACASLDCVSFFTADAADARAVFGAVATRDRRDPWSRALAVQRPRGGAPRVGVPREAAVGFLGDAVAAAAWRAALGRAGVAGWEVVEFDFAPLAEAARLLYGGPWLAERYAAVGDFIATHRADVDPVVAEIVLEGERTPAVDLFRALHRLAALRARVEALWPSLDALLMPAAPTQFTHEQVAADPRGTVDALGTYTNFANLLDLAGVAVPGAERTDGLPFGVQLLGPAGSDRRLLALAGLWEASAAPSAEASSVTSLASHRA
jgi:allophanate hydrolase